MTTAKPSTNGPKRRRSARVEERSRAEAEAQAAAPETPLAKTGKLSSLSESRKARTKVTFQIEIPVLMDHRLYTGLANGSRHHHLINDES